MSLMSNLYVGMSGLNVSQNAVNTTAHNIVNVDTRGYTRQQTIISDFMYRNIGWTDVNTLQVGFGSKVTGVVTYRDLFLDQSYRHNLGSQGFYEAQAEAVDEIENLLGETEGVAFQNSISSLWESMQELAKEPGNIVARSTFVQTSVSFVERAKNISEQLSKYQQSLNTNILQQVDKVNSIGAQINELNQQITKYESNGVEHANDYRDQRNQLLDDLSQIVKISYKEDMTGAVCVSIEGVSFVNQNTLFPMEVSPVSDSSTLLKPTWPHLDDQDVFNPNQKVSSENRTDVGYLKGLVLGRGKDEANYTDIPVRENYSSEAEYNKAVNEYNKHIDSSVIMTMQAQLDQLIHGIVTTINDVLCPNKEITAADGTKYMVLDTENAPVGIDENATQGEALFNRNNMDRYTKKVIDGETYYVYNEENPEDIYSLYTVRQLEVNPDIIENLSKLPLSSNGGTGDYDLQTVQKLMEKWQEPFATLSPNTLTKSSFNDYYTNMIGALGNRGDQLKTLAKSQSEMVHTIESERNSVLGVSQDEELTNLIRFQHSYNASARYITVVNEMLEHIVSNL